MTKHNVKVCMGSSCFARGNLQNLNFLENYIKENNKEIEIELVGAHCQEKCDIGPNIYIDEKLYNEVNEDKLKEIINSLK